MNTRLLRLAGRVPAVCCLAASLLAATAAHGGQLPPPVFLKFDTELLSLNLTGPTVALPLAPDPGNALGDSIDGYGFVNSQVQITLSSMRAVPGPRSLGTSCAFEGSPAAASPAAAAAAVQSECDFFEQQFGLPLINPAELDGHEFRINSFFDVFFDITATDVDPRPGRNFPGGLPAVQFNNNGPASMQSFYFRNFDANAPNFGLIPPPESDPYIGHFNIEIPLPVDINGNGELDKIKFTLASHAAGDANRTFIILPDGTVIDNFDSTAILNGAVVDQSSDPPFTLNLAGPTTASSNLLNDVVPEPGTCALALLSLGGGWLLRRRMNCMA